MKRFEEVPDRGGCREGVPEETREGGILAQRYEILATLLTAGPERDQTLHALLRPEPPLALVDRHLGVDHVGHPELAELLDYQGGYPPDR
jgi:hypothetical protein